MTECIGRFDALPDAVNPLDKLVGEFVQATCISWDDEGVRLAKRGVSRQPKSPWQKSALPSISS
ncbi:MAG: hypothetical protein OXF73_09235 [Gammaproteobacteria bacterium]|nr:hypothetical protein [Gammaproteobacteria bacterium]MCY4227522.1 hypothetical protein [Gammaproteobacteria bacterium]